jgi:hypothetical protein
MQLERLEKLVLNIRFHRKHPEVRPLIQILNNNDFLEY